MGDEITYIAKTAFFYRDINVERKKATAAVRIIAAPEGTSRS